MLYGTIPPMTILREPHPGKQLEVEVNGDIYTRYPVRTPVVMKGDDLIGILKKEIGEEVKTGDMVLVAESALSAAQGRAIPIDEIHPGWLANFLTKYMTKTDAGIGASDPLTMQVVIEEVGYLRVLLGAAVAAITKPLGISGFYRVTGDQSRGVDGPADYVIPPYNKHVVRAPEKPGQWAKEAERALGDGVTVLVMDANDIGINIFGKCSHTEEKLAKALAFDNPLGQSDESTPILFCRKRKK
jgi:hypothetical protein